LLAMFPLLSLQPGCIKRVAQPRDHDGLAGR
jgi:hypothetical protein